MKYWIAIMLVMALASCGHGPITKFGDNPRIIAKKLPPVVTWDKDDGYYCIANCL